MDEYLQGIWDEPIARVVAIIVGSLVVAKIGERVFRRTVIALARRTLSTLDDTVAEALERPFFITVVLVGLGWASREAPIHPVQLFRIDAVLETLAVVVWASAAFKIGSAVLTSLARRSTATSIVQPRTMSVFEMINKLTVVGASAYFILLAWRLDVTGWLASAGIIGIAVGFAAQDTLANLFSGIFIVADAPYKVGDFIVLDGELRGKVTHIGIRSTRVLTIDDVEITVPNAVIGGSKIINENGGPSPSQRISVGVDAAYGSDIDQVRAVLLTCPTGIAHVAASPAPQVRFREMGASGLHFELLVWIEDASQRGAVIDALNCAIYKAFYAAAIEIPYAKQDVYIKEFPTRRAG